MEDSAGAPDAGSLPDAAFDHLTLGFEARIACDTEAPLADLVTAAAKTGNETTPASATDKHGYHSFTLPLVDDEVGHVGEVIVDPRMARPPTGSSPPVNPLSCSTCSARCGG